MKIRILPVVALAAAAGIASGPALAGKADDTLNWATDREVAVVDPYYNNTRELVVMGHLGWDALLFRNLDIWAGTPCCSATSTPASTSRFWPPA
jgi:peptide/nickel transport system substrate-binding protein